MRERERERERDREIEDKRERERIFEREMYLVYTVCHNEYSRNKFSLLNRLIKNVKFYHNLVFFAVQRKKRNDIFIRRK